MAQPKLFSIIDKAIFDYKLIEEGDRILVGASGGKDSTALIEYFAARKSKTVKTSTLPVFTWKQKSALLFQKDFWIYFTSGMWSQLS